MSRNFRLFLGSALLVLLVWVALLVRGAMRDELGFYRETLDAYLVAVQQSDASAIKRVVCRSVLDQIGTEDSSWEAALAAEKQRVGPISAFNPLRGEARTAFIELLLNGKDRRIVRLPIVEEDGRLVPCPDGSRLLGEPI